MKIDITKSAVTNTVALVNDANPGLALQETRVAFDSVAPAVGEQGRNTSVRVYAQEGKGLSGSVVVTYYRPSLLEQTETPSLDYDAAVTASEADVLVKICTALEVLSDEVKWNTYNPGAAGQSTTSILAAKEGSLLYQGEISLTITWTAT